VPPSERSDVIKRILPSTVQLRADRGGGARRAASGVVIASDAVARRSWIVTTRHFLEPARDQRLSLSLPGRPSTGPVTVVAVSEDADLALVVVDGIALRPVTLKDVVQLGEEVWVVGFPWGRRLTLVSGIVSQIAAEEPGDVLLEGPVRMVDASVSYGASGGGVFETTSGALVGIVEGYRTARVTLQTTPERVLDIPVPGETTVVAAPVIRRFLSTANVDALRRH
jgi:S1-C subfamily serine protease